MLVKYCVSCKNFVCPDRCSCPKCGQALAEVQVG